MNDTESIQRDLWRLALLLTGSVPGATAALTRALRAHENIRKLSEDRRRRLVILGAREWLSLGGAPDPGDSSPAGRSSRLASTLEALPREVWALREVMRWGEIETARATGVARAAESTYLTQAIETMRAALGHDYEPAVAALRERWQSVDATAGVAAAREGVRSALRRKRVMAALQTVLLFIAMAVIAWIGTDLIRASKQERSNKALQDAISNPMSPEDAAKMKRDAAREAPSGKPVGGAR